MDLVSHGQILLGLKAEESLLNKGCDASVNAVAQARYRVWRALLEQARTALECVQDGRKTIVMAVPLDMNVHDSVRGKLHHHIWCVNSCY